MTMRDPQRRLKVEIVTHCYNYTTPLRFQLSSLVLGPPRHIDVVMTVYYTRNDARTSEALQWFETQQVPGVTWQWKEQPLTHLCRRSIGRNDAAQHTLADWVWFCDADYWFGPECWDAFATLELPDAPLIFPRFVNTHRSHAFGDQNIARGAGIAGLVSAERSEFSPARMVRAIGGIQITNGEVCRKIGYLAKHKWAQLPRDPAVWKRCKEDVWFRHELRTEGAPANLPGVYRIRHSQAGRHTPGLLL